MPGGATAVLGVPPVTGGSGGVGSTGGLLNSNQVQFAERLAADTGLDPNVVGAWVHLEEPSSASSAPNGANNWLNIGATGSGNFAGSDPAWNSPLTAADQTAAWLKGSSIPGYGAASSGIQAIMGTAGQSADAQISAIQHSGWAGSGYPNFSSVYNLIKAHPLSLGDVGSAIASPVTGVVNAASDVGHELKNIGQAIIDVVQALTNLNNWLRFGEVILGAILLITAIRALTGGSADPVDTLKSGVKAGAAVSEVGV